MCTHSSQSTATMRLMSDTGRPTDVSTRIIMTRPALGMLAAPILANVAVRLYNTRTHTHVHRVAQNKIPHQTICNIFSTSGEIFKILEGAVDTLYTAGFGEVSGLNSFKKF